jgi:hypothetical protein
VNTVLKDFVKRHKRRQLFEWLANGGLPDLADESVMEQAWR